MKSSRDKFTTRKIILAGQAQKDLACAAIHNAPIGLEVLIREEVKARKPDQNSLMWAGPLKDIEQQAYVEGRTYRDTVWHEHFKELYLPEEFDPELTKEGYRKWSHTPSGKRVLIGSTTQLTVKGFSQYLEQVMAFGANLGVLFSTREGK